MSPEAPAPPPRIARFQPLSAQRIRIHLDDDSTLDIPVDLFATEGLSSGDPVDGQLRSRLVEAALRWKIREAALRLLAHRARSRTELRRRLRKKDFPKGLVEACLDELEERSLIDDSAFARSFVRDRLRLRPRGRRLLDAELGRKGVAPEARTRAIDEVFDDEAVSDGELAREAALGWLRRQPPDIVRLLGNRDRSPEREKARRRLQGYLARRGFAGGPAFDAMDEARRAATERSTASDSDPIP